MTILNKSVESLADYMVQNAADLVVLDEKTAQKALTYALGARRMLKTLDEQRKEAAKPYNDYVKKWKPAVDKYKDVETEMMIRAQVWMARNDYMTLTTDQGKMTAKEGYTYQIVMISDVPRQYLKIDEEAVKKDIEAGVRNIPGLEITKENTYRMRLDNDV